jgi:hypothetical protein
MHIVSNNLSISTNMLNIETIDLIEYRPTGQSRLGESVRSCDSNREEFIFSIFLKFLAQ